MLVLSLTLQVLCKRNLFEKKSLHFLAFMSMENLKGNPHDMTEMRIVVICSSWRKLATPH